MATPTYTPIASITLGSSASSVEFSSIPQDYRDLVLVIAGTTTANANLDLDVNGTGTSGSRVFMFGSGSSTNSGTRTTLVAGYSTTTQSSHILQVQDYSATDKHKTMLIRRNATANGVEAAAQRWANTAAITSLDISPESTSFESGTTFALYGIEA